MSKAGKLRVPDSLKRIREAIRRIHHDVTDMDEARFLVDEKPRTPSSGISRSLARLAGTLIHITPTLRKKHSEVPWGFAYEMCNALAHRYFMVDLEIVWKTIHADLPDLAVQISA